MKSARLIMNKATAQSRAVLPSNLNNTDDLDDTLPIELLECVETTTNEDWLTRPINFHKLNCVPPTFCEKNREQGFSPHISTNRYNSDGSSSDFSQTSMTTECGSVPDDDVSQENENDDHFIPPLLPAASMEFQPLRCSTAVTVTDLVQTNNVETFQIRVDTDEFKHVKVPIVQQRGSANFKPLRCSTGIVDENVVGKNVQRHESIEFNPLRCSTGLDSEEAVVSGKSRPNSPDEIYFSARNTFGGNSLGKDSDGHFVTALGGAEQTTERNLADRLSTESPAVQVTELATDQPKTNVDNDLSILMHCHLKIRNGRNIVSNLQAKPHIELAVYKNSPGSTAGIPETLESKPKSLETKIKIPNKTRPNQQNGLNSKLTGGKIQIKFNETESSNFVAPSVSKLNVGQKLNRGNAPNCTDDRQSDPRKRLERAIDNLASSNIQRVVLALPTLDSARSASLCETFVQQGLIDNLYEFLLKMNRSIAHQVACVHASSLLVDLAKYNYSTESVWQVLRRFVTPQNKVLEKISAKLGTKILRPASGKFPVPTLQPSWFDAGIHRAFQSPCVALSELSAALKQPLTRAK